MKWAKRLAIVAVILIAVIAACVHLFLNSVVRTVVQNQATASLNVPTTLGGAMLSIFGGSVSLSDLEIGSPQGFTAPHTFTLGGVAVAVNYGQLRANPIHISKITIDDPALFIEQSNLKLNLQALMDGIPQTPKTSSGQPSEPLKLIIDELDLNNAQVTFMPGLPGLTAQVPIPIPSLTLNNIGNGDGNQNGVAIKQVVMQVMTALAAKAGDSAQLPPELKALLSGSLGNISGQLGSVVGKLQSNIGGLLSGVNGVTGGSNTNGNAGAAPVNQAQNAIKGLLDPETKHQASRQ